MYTFISKKDCISIYKNIKVRNIQVGSILENGKEKVIILGAFITDNNELYLIVENENTQEVNKVRCENIWSLKKVGHRKLTTEETARYGEYGLLFMNILTYVELAVKIRVGTVLNFYDGLKQEIILSTNPLVVCTVFFEKIPSEKGIAHYLNENKEEILNQLKIYNTLSHIDMLNLDIIKFYDEKTIKTFVSKLYFLYGDITKYAIKV